MNFLAFVFCSLSLAMVQQSTPLPGATDVKEKLQQRLNELFTEAAYPGITVGFFLADGTSGSVAAGMADLEERIPMRPGDVMLAGSVGKIFCAAVTLQLVQEGRLALDDPIGNWFSADNWFSRLPNGTDITVRMLLNHTSGIPRYVFEKAFQTDLLKDAAHVWKPHELVGYILDKEATFPAGKGFAYADTNYLMLGMIIEKVSGDTYYNQVRKRLLQKYANIHPTDTLQVPGLVPGYPGERDPLGFPSKMVIAGKVQANIQFEWTGGGFAVAVEDLARFAHNLYQGRLPQPEHSGRNVHHGRGTPDPRPLRSRCHGPQTTGPTGLRS